ncbi:bifunctional diaminohydroxyphosphoribosylaminopyrimidine deaminase/5-amino-6-(5-phosphoribosylamino)uracil reductase RibD [Desulfovibrio sp. UCD-KL4C]|uniref:bifunctional diaminohydroxyphosphoribosylaminopyrimidine deaminase/5-amino-6-(5-phosphoribosylamino)uracil reductase RibD n=1 Tax=Desulfovibrio sp. UCD-KL4C TaxID=2578120 RepID=UPI0025C45363|nr:bifunctional diaminohydroxyphosphoribosylaminopyrimidine deaminase/5-amino-6-(5-phosphoribosylamino)uracil reductase RibD [Desulfovibrio sp. UCD-KL4C]
MNFCSSTFNSSEQFMARAVSLALRGRARTAPNPTVGAVMVRDGQIVAEGWHQYCGGLHAERNCIAEAKAQNVDMTKCTMFVTLEPCNHYGKTPPCTEGIIEAGIPHIVVGTRDPNPKAAGGLEFLKSKGVKVETGVLEEQCLDLISDFLTWQNTNRPYSILKLASTLDGKIAGTTGRQEAVSSPDSFEDVQKLRTIVGAVIIGGNTLREDNPSLNCRLEIKPEGFTQPKAVVVTTKLPKNHEAFTLTTTRAKETIFWTTTEQAASETAKELINKGIEIIGLPCDEKGLIFDYGFKFMREKHGVLRTLCEGGGKLALSLVEQDLIDEFVMYQAPRILGNSLARANFAGSDKQFMEEALNFRVSRVSQSGCDLKIVFKPADR